MIRFIRYTSFLVYIAAFIYNVRYILTPVIDTYGWSNFLITVLSVFVICFISSFTWFRTFSMKPPQATRKPKQTRGHYGPQTRDEEDIFHS